MGKLRFARVLNLPQTLSPGTIYILPKEGGVANLVIVDEVGSVTRTIEGFTSEQIKNLCRVTNLTGLDVSTAADVVASDDVVTAIGKLQAQAKLFGQGVEGRAIYSATEFTSVPTEFKAYYIVVTQPHIRMMTWDGAKYVRAPWHRPGVLFHSNAGASKITNALPMRGDVLYRTADYPDLAEMYAFTGETFNLWDARARVLRSADLGKGIDASLVDGTYQEDATRRLAGGFTTIVPGTHANYTTGAFSASSGSNTSTTTNPAAYPGPLTNGDRYVEVNNYGYHIDSSRTLPTANENRVKSFVASIYVTF